MSMYAYECGPCMKIFRPGAPIDDRELPTSCPECSRPTVRRIFEGPFSKRRTGPVVRMINCTAIDGGGAGLYVGASMTVHAVNTTLIRNRVAVEVAEGGTLYDDYTTIE